MRTRRVEKRRVAGDSIDLGENALGGRGSRDAGGAGEIQLRLRCLTDGEIGDDDRRLKGYVRRGPRNRHVAHMADLAMIFVVSESVPVADRVDRKKGEDEYDEYRQQSCGRSLLHHQPQSSPNGMLAEMPFHQQVSPNLCVIQNAMG
jgi:hypothetical protein